MKQQKATEYLKFVLGDFIRRFPVAKIRYKFEALSNLHCVEVLPRALFQSETKYLDWERRAIDEFIELFPDQNLLFCTEGDPVRVENAEFELT
jgi:hypothetical protein